MAELFERQFHLSLETTTAEAFVQTIHSSANTFVAEHVCRSTAYQKEIAHVNEDSIPDFTRGATRATFLIMLKEVIVLHPSTKPFLEGMIQNPSQENSEVTTDVTQALSFTVSPIQFGLIMLGYDIANIKSAPAGQKSQLALHDPNAYINGYLFVTNSLLKNRPYMISPERN